MRTAGVVLAGGRSTRMGESKAGLEWHGSTLLYRAAAVLGRSVDGPVVVVAAPGQELPALPGGVSVVEDPVVGLGPMQGLAAGLAAVADRADAAFVCSTDLPFLHPAFVRRVLAGLADGVEVALPVARGFRQPLAAAYRTSLAGLVAKLVADGQLRLGMLFEHCKTAQLGDAELSTRHDPGLDSLVNVNTPEDYAAARRRPPPEVTIGPGAIRAATLGAAAATLGLAMDGTVQAVVNSGPVTADGQLPLVAGDTVTFLSEGDEA